MILDEQQAIKKVLMTADTVGGVWTYALDLCRAYHNRGIQVCLATMGAPLSVSQQAEVSQIPSLDIRESHYKLEWMENPWEDVKHAGEWLLNLEKEIEPDIIHLNGYAHAALSWHAPVVVVAHSCVLSWWQGVIGGQAPVEWDGYKHCITQGLKAADVVVAISHTYAQQLEQLYGYDNDIKVIYNGRDTSLFYTTDKNLQAFAMGRIWDEAKNLSLLGQLTNKAQLPILVAGNNRHPDNGELVSIPNVHMLGTLSPAEVREQLAASAIYILPAKYEPFGLSVLEAALSGCLLLLADIPTLKELWQDTALYFNPGQPDELDTLLNEVTQNWQQYQHLTQRAKVRAQMFSLDTMVNNYLTLYQNMLQKAALTKVIN